MLAIFVLAHPHPSRHHLEAVLWITLVDLVEAKVSYVVLSVSQSDYVKWKLS